MSGTAIVGLGNQGFMFCQPLAPRMVLLRPPHDPDSGGWRNWQRDSPCRLLQFGKADSLPAVVHLHSPVLPFTNQCLALCGTVALLSRVQLSIVPLVLAHPVPRHPAL